MKKIKIVNLALGVLVLVSIILTPAKFYYVFFQRYFDNVILGVVVLTLVMVVLDKSKSIVQSIALLILILAVFYTITSAYFSYYDGDILYKEYRLKYLKIGLSDPTIKLFEYLNQFCLVLPVLIEFVLIFVFLKIFLKYKETLAGLSKPKGFSE